MHRHDLEGQSLAVRQRGLTMVELLVAMVISLLIALAAIAALTVSRQGFATVDAASQLRDNGRFAADLIQRLGVQSGYKDAQYTAQWATQQYSATNPEPSIMGANNALSTVVTGSTAPYNSSTARAAGSLGYGSDILYLRNQLVQLNVNSTAADGSMIDCMGTAPTAGAAPTARNDVIVNILHVAESPVGSGELALMCTSVTGNGTVINPRQPIVQGVENFQVLYGVQGVTANAPTAAASAVYGLNASAPAPASSAAWQVWNGNVDQEPDTYLRADEMTVAGNTAATYDNWRRVRSLRIGLILRGPAHSAQNAVAQTLYPFGQAKSSSTGTPGSAFADSANDPGTSFDAPADGRLRQVVTFTVHVRNSQIL